jgi:hypothetical protein
MRDLFTQVEFFREALGFTRQHYGFSSRLSRTSRVSRATVRGAGRLFQHPAKIRFTDRSARL